MPTHNKRIQVTEERELAAALRTGRERALEELADHFRNPETAPWDSRGLREVKRSAWPVR